MHTQLMVLLLVKLAFAQTITTELVYWIDKSQCELGAAPIMCYYDHIPTCTWNGYYYERRECNGTRDAYCAAFNTCTNCTLITNPTVNCSKVSSTGSTVYRTYCGRTCTNINSNIGVMRSNLVDCRTTDINPSLLSTDCIHQSKYSCSPTGITNTTYENTGCTGKIVSVTKLKYKNLPDSCYSIDNLHFKFHSCNGIQYNSTTSASTNTILAIYAVLVAINIFIL